MFPDLANKLSPAYVKYQFFKDRSNVDVTTITSPCCSDRSTFQRSFTALISNLVDGNRIGEQSTNWAKCTCCQSTLPKNPRQLIKTECPAHRTIWRRVQRIRRQADIEYTSAIPHALPPIARVSVSVHGRANGLYTFDADVGQKVGRRFFLHTSVVWPERCV